MATGAVVGQVPLDFFGPQVPAGMTVGAGLLGALPFHAWTVGLLLHWRQILGVLAFWWCSGVEPKVDEEVC